MQVQPNIILLEATSQRWISGVRGGGQSVEYNFKVLVNTNVSLRFDSVWLHNEKFPVKLLKNHRLISPTILQKKDTATLLISESIAPAEHPSDTLITLAPMFPPVNFEGAALIRFYAGREKKYLICKQIARLPDIHGQ